MISERRTTHPQVYDQSVKGYVLVLEGGRDSRLLLPPSERDSLGLIQPYLVLQMQVRLSPRRAARCRSARPFARCRRLPAAPRRAPPRIEKAPLVD